MRSKEETSTPSNTNDNDNTTSNNTSNNTNNTNTTSTTYTPRDKLLHLVSLLPSTLKDKENLSTTIHKLGDRFSSFLGIQGQNQEHQAGHEEHKEKERERKKNEDEGIDEGEFVIVPSNEDITKEIKDEELAKALQQEGISPFLTPHTFFIQRYTYHHLTYFIETHPTPHVSSLTTTTEIDGLKRQQEAQQRAVRQRQRELQTRDAERRRHEEEQQMRRYLSPQGAPDLFTLLLFGLGMFLPYFTIKVTSPNCSIYFTNFSIVLVLVLFDSSSFTDPPSQRQQTIRVMGEPSLAPMVCACGVGEEEGSEMNEREVRDRERKRQTNFHLHLVHIVCL